VIAFMHTQAWRSMVGLDHLPRVGEFIRVAPGAGLVDDHDGLYEVICVMHTVGSGRVDLYATRVADAGPKVGWDDVMSKVCAVASGDLEQGDRSDGPQ
jgi:hypothetical protein